MLRNNLKRALFATFFLCLTSFVQVAANNVEFTVNAPLMVSVGETFRVEFSLNDDADRNTFTPPSFEGFAVLAGPSVSTGSSVSIVNGHMTRSKRSTYTYVLVADQEGNYTIGSAAVMVDKKQYKTKPLPIDVVKQTQSNAPQSGGRPATSTHDASQGDVSNYIGKDDILLKMNLSRRSLYKGEPLRATLKLYSRVPIVGGEQSKMPSFNGFWKQEVPFDSDASSRETVNGVVYEVRTLSDYLLYPQQSGELTIEPASMVVIAQVVMQGRGGANPFFGGREVYNVRRAVSSEKITINVKELPVGAPASFSGAVGIFSIESSLSSNEISANSAASLNVRIAGEGNLSFVQAPKVSLPTSFELYNVKQSESLSTRQSGTVGYKQFEYPFIARSQGEFDIPAVEFSFFNPRSQSYEVIKGAPLNVDVTPDLNSRDEMSDSHVVRTITKGDVKMLGQDIRFIKLGSGELTMGVATPFIMSGDYYLILFAIVATIFVAYFVIRRQMQINGNAVLVKGRRANKIAVQRFKAAKQYMISGDERAFYEEILRAMWGYMSDKFNIPVASLTRESVRDELQRRGASQELLPRFAMVITECDQAQYSPMASSQMSEVYNEALDFISCVETQIKR